MAEADSYGLGNDGVAIYLFLMKYYKKEMRENGTTVRHLKRRRGIWGG